MYLLNAIILLPLATHAANLVLSNDDGWAEINIRTFHDALTAAGNYVVLSAPADDESGRGSRDAPAKPRVEPCTFNACPANSPPQGFNASNPLLNYVNSYPVTSIKHGIYDVAPKFFGTDPPDLAVSGPNLGSNLGPTVFFSGTVGAAVYAAHNAGIPSIAFSGRVGKQTPWYADTPVYSQIYADLATNLTSAILAGGPPYLPAGVWLNVNFPVVSDDSDATQFKFVLSRIFGTLDLVPDVKTCGSDRLPIERDVVTTEGDVYISVSVGDASNKRDANVEAQAFVLERLNGLLSCLPVGSSNSEHGHQTAQVEGQVVFQEEL